MNCITTSDIAVYSTVALAVLLAPHAMAVFIVVLVVAVLVAVWFAKFMMLLLPVTAPTDCICVMLCVVEDAAALALTPALAEATAAVGVTYGFQTVATGSQTGIALTVLTSQHCVTTQHATVGQQHVVGHAQLQHVEVVQLVHCAHVVATLVVEAFAAH